MGVPLYGERLELTMLIRGLKSDWNIVDEVDAGAANVMASRLQPVFMENEKVAPPTYSANY
jgi:hypothetical protein